MDDKIERVGGERQQQPIELEQPPLGLVAASALSESNLRHLHELNPEAAQAIVDQDAACAAHWRLDVIARAPTEWMLYSKPRGSKDPERIARREPLD